MGSAGRIGFGRSIVPVGVFAFVGVLTLAHPARAQEGCDPQNPIADSFVSGAETTSTAFNDSAIIADPYNSTTWISKGLNFRGYWNVTGNGHTAGTQRAVLAFSTNLAGDPYILPMYGQGGQDLAVVVANSNGRGYRHNFAGASNQFSPAVAWTADLRRSTCPLDTTTMTPLVILQNYFACDPILGCRDRVVYGTRRHCGSNGNPPNYTNNQIIMVDGGSAGNATVLWMTSPSLQLDFATSCVMEDNGGSPAMVTAIYCTFARPPYGNQPTMMKINPSTGAVIWAADHDDIRSVPRLLPGNDIYVATYSGTLKVINSTNGQLKYTLPITGTANIVESPYVETRFGGGNQRTVFSVDTDGFVHGQTIINGVSTNMWDPFWPMNSSAFKGSGTPSFDPVRNKIYVPTIAGTVYQYSGQDAAQQASTPEATFVVGTGPVVRPTIDYEGTNWGDHPNRVSLVGGTTGGTQIRRVCGPVGNGGSGGRAGDGEGGAGPAGGALPLATGENCTDDSECKADRWETECTTGVCMFPDVKGLTGGEAPVDAGVCVAKPKAEGTLCGDGGCLAPGQGQCLAGVCQPRPGISNSCVCDASSEPGAKGCDFTMGESCCPGGCKKLAEDLNNCGACGKVCPPGTECGNGVCHEPQCSDAPTANELVAAIAAGSFESPIAASYVREWGHPSCRIAVGTAAGEIAVINKEGVLDFYYQNTGGGKGAHPYGSMIADRTGNVLWAARGPDEGDPTGLSGLTYVGDNVTAVGGEHDLQSPKGYHVPFQNRNLNGWNPLAIRPLPGNSYMVYVANVGADGEIRALMATPSGQAGSYDFADSGFQLRMNVHVSGLEYYQVTNGTLPNPVPGLYIATSEPDGPFGGTTERFWAVPDLDNLARIVEIPLQFESLNDWVARILPFRQSNGDAVIPVRVHNWGNFERYDLFVVNGFDLVPMLMNDKLAAYGQPEIAINLDATVATYGSRGLVIELTSGGLGGGEDAGSGNFIDFNLRPWDLP